MKRVAVLDMWGSQSAESGPSKHWLYNKLAESFDIDVITLPRSRRADLWDMLRTFRPSRARWGARYYAVRELASKRPAAFRRNAALFERQLDKTKKHYDLFFQIGALSAPIETLGIPYISYHDQTMKMVETANPEWLPPDFRTFRDEWYSSEQLFYQSMTKVVAYSSFTQASIVHDYQVPADRVTVIPTACKLSYPDREVALQARKHQLLFVTTGFFRKGGDLLLEAFPLIKARVPDIELIIAGGRLPESVRIQDPAIKYVGTLSHADLKRYYLSAALLVHPARYDAFPNVLKESLACGLPIVASGVCGIPEILEYGEAGVIMQKADAEDIARSVCTMLSDATLYHNIQQRSLNARERYRIDIVGDQFSDLFRRCMSETAAGGVEIAQ